MTPSTETMVEAISDRVVGIALIIALCFCWRQTCQYWTQRLQVRAAERPNDADPRSA